MVVGRCAKMGGERKKKTVAARAWSRVGVAGPSLTEMLYWFAMLQCTLRTCYNEKRLLERDGWRSHSHDSRGDVNLGKSDLLLCLHLLDSVTGLFE